MAQALRRHTHGRLEENGIVRSTVFPNAVRDMRVKKGFETLRSFGPNVSDVTYTRLAKIERGEIFPTAPEMRSISRALGVQVSSLLIDPSTPGFDREAWARDHIEAKLANRGGGIDAMKLGAAMRVKRLEMSKSTTDMKEFGLPAATVSRIENAERPIERWDAGIQRGIARVLGVRGNASVTTRVEKMFEAGTLDQMLHDLFSPDAIDERNKKRLRQLLSQLDTKKAHQMLHDLDSVPVMSGKATEDGRFNISASERRVHLPEGVGPDSLAIEIVEPVLGPGLPRGTVVVVDPDQKPVDGDVVAVISKGGNSVRMLSVSDEDGDLVGFSMKSDAQVKLSDLPRGSRIARMVAAVA